MKTTHWHKVILLCHFLLCQSCVVTDAPRKAFDGSWFLLTAHITGYAIIMTRQPNRLTPAEGCLWQRPISSTQVQFNHREINCAVRSRCFLPLAPPSADLGGWTRTADVDPPVTLVTGLQQDKKNIITVHLCASICLGFFHVGTDWLLNHEWVTTWKMSSCQGVNGEKWNLCCWERLE